MTLFEQLTKLVSIPSEYPNEQNLAEYIFGVLEQLNFKVSRQVVSENRFNVLAEKGTGKSILLFMHLDTVEREPDWQTNPYKLVKRGDKLYGLGAWDMKSGLAAILDAVKGFNPQNYKLKLVFLVDEEYYSVGMHTLAQSGWLKDVVGSITPEPGFIHGLEGVAMGRIGRVVYKVSIQTNGGHVYLAKKNANAIVEAQKVINAVTKIKPVNHPQLGESLIFPRFIQGGKSSMSIPDTVEMELECQTVPPQTIDSLQAQLKGQIQKAGIGGQVKIEPLERPTPFCEPYIQDQNSSFVEQVLKIQAYILGSKPKIYYRRSVGDENRVAALGIPVLTIGPEGGNAHQANEWVSEKSLMKMVSLYRALIADLDK